MNREELEAVARKAVIAWIDETAWDQDYNAPPSSACADLVDRFAAVLQHLASQRQEQGEGWRQIAEQESRNRDYYRSLVVEIGELFGVEARTADDGGIAEGVLCAKVPELVRAQAAAQGEALRIETEDADSLERKLIASQALVARLGELLRRTVSDTRMAHVAHPLREEIRALLAEIAPTTKCTCNADTTIEPHANGCAINRAPATPTP